MNVLQDLRSCARKILRTLGLGVLRMGGIHSGAGLIPVCVCVCGGVGIHSGAGWIPVCVCVCVCVGIRSGAGLIPVRVYVCVCVYVFACEYI